MTASHGQTFSASDFLRLEVFSPHVGADFGVKRGNDLVKVQLTEGKPLRGHQAVTCEKFSLLFTGGLEKPLQQGMHEFEHDMIGAFELFITPVQSPKPDLRWYEAIINRESVL